MIEIKGHNIANLPVGTLNKVSDLLFYDGPILSHFKNEKGQNYLFYWVDVDEKYNRWLIWKVTDIQIYNYLKGFSTLKDIILEKNKDFIYHVDIDDNLVYNNVKAIDLDELTPDYVPDDNYYFDSLLIPMYKELISQFEEKLYLPLLKQNAVYFTLEPRQLTFSTTVSAIDAGNFLRKLANSFLCFVEFDFYESFKSTISDLKKLNRIIEEFKEILSPRVVDLQYGSFKVAISTDTVKTVESQQYKEWQKFILEKYKNDVIEIDYNSVEDLKGIAEKYPENVIKNVHMPIIEIINDKKYKISIRDNKRRFYKTYALIPKINIDTLLPKAIMEKSPDENKKLISIVLEVSENDDIQKIGKKEIQSGMLFSQEIQRFPFNFTEIKYRSTSLYLKRALICELFIENNITHLENKEFDIVIQSKNSSEIFEKFNSRFIELYIDLSENESNYSRETVEKMKSIIEKVEMI